ncbi:uncharacterized protein LOC117251373 isoform X2 [Epinephelus lanceolatus]
MMRLHRLAVLREHLNQSTIMVIQKRRVTLSVPKKKAISQKGSTPITHPQQSSASPLSSRSNAPSTRPSSFAAPPLPPQPPPGLFSIAAPPPPPPRLSSTAAPPPSPSPPGPSAHAAPPELPPPEPTLTELTSFVTSYTSSFHPPPPGLSSLAPQPPLPSFEHFHSSQSTNPLETVSEVFMPTLRAGRSGREPIPCTPAELHMLTLLENLKHQLNQQSSVMNLLMSRLNAAREPASEMPDDISFPLSSLAEVDCFEDWLNDPANAMKKKQMVAVLASLEGRDIKHVTWNILAHIFSSSVAKQINWKGVNNKKKFSEMATKALLARAVRKNHQGEKATDMEINHHSIRWFNLASDRGGGRRQRSQQTMSQ